VARGIPRHGRIRVQVLLDEEPGVVDVRGVRVHTVDAGLKAERRIGPVGRSWTRRSRGDIAAEVRVPGVHASLEADRPLAAELTARTQYGTQHAAVTALEDLLRRIVDDPVRLAGGRTATRSRQRAARTIQIVEVLRDVERRPDLGPSPVR